MRKQIKITNKILIGLLSYDKFTGIFRWKKKSKNRKIGSIAGWIRKDDGYRQIGLCGKTYFAHRLAWFYFYEKWPIDQLDHINGLRHDNRMANLREATASQNSKNFTLKTKKKLGYKGVFEENYIYRKKKYRSKILVSGKEISLGYFKTPIEAHLAYKKAIKKYYGDFARSQ